MAAVLAAVRIYFRIFLFPEMAVLFVELFCRLYIMAYYPEFQGAIISPSFCPDFVPFAGQVDLEFTYIAGSVKFGLCLNFLSPVIRVIRRVCR